MASKNYIIYKIICDDLPDFIYVGSTCDFNYRKRKHKENCKNVTGKEYNKKLYTTIRDNGEWENWRMIQIHQAPNVTKREAETIEEEYRVELKANLNMVRAFLSPEIKVEERKARDKLYNASAEGKAANYIKCKNYSQTENGKAAIIRFASKRYVCDCGKEICIKEKSRHEKTEFHLNYIKEQN